MDPALLERTAALAAEFLRTLPDRPVGATSDLETLRRELGGALPDDGEPPEQVIDELARRADGGLFATAGPRFFGFVIGGSLPAALAADWLTSAWDQNAGLYVAAPANSVVEEVAGEWLRDLFGLPATASFGLTTGCMMANFTALAAARHAVLARAGWDVERDGLFGAPPVDVVLGAEAHATIGAALQYLGMGRERVTIVPTDEQGRIRSDALRDVLAARDTSRPLIVCAQAGNVNTGAFDPLVEIAGLVRDQANAWLHVDGAFGLWAAASERTRHLTRGVELADSWATDAHKWLNVPYDCGIVFVADPASHRAAMAPPTAAYLVYAANRERDPVDWVPEYSRRARGFTVYAAMRSLGRGGVAALVDRCCTLARRMADQLSGEPGVTVLNDVVLNQVLVRFTPPSSDGARTRADNDGAQDRGDERTRAVIRAVQDDGSCWLSGTTWHGMAAMRISVSNWSTTEADADASAEAIARVARRTAGPAP
ncbi:MAG: aminotransferase class V-fold PLP-dependent enzyme [Chloroflexota bacterium]|nr:aminotransferase class V-fold PLP-dependent enzyme [Chloroflexota bacterium]